MKLQDYAAGGGALWQGLKSAIIQSFCWLGIKSGKSGDPWPASQTKTTEKSCLNGWNTASCVLCCGRCLVSAVLGVWCLVSAPLGQWLPDRSVLWYSDTIVPSVLELHQSYHSSECDLLVLPCFICRLTWKLSNSSLRPRTRNWLYFPPMQQNHVNLAT